ncbi:MAG: aminopeptidase P family protein [Candidatus Omnitrophica bacterium]|nr:aminopeptidase P family protein [Candidatus Omnitrophota bacterium]
MEERRKRIKDCLKSIERAGLDALLVSNPYNIKYLTGFREANGYLLISPKGVVYFTNFIYAQEAKKITLWKIEVVDYNLFETIVKKIYALKINNLGFESKHLPFLEYKEFKKNLNMRGINFIKTIDLIENLRAVKTQEEIALIKKAVDITLEGFKFAKELIDPAITERKLALEVERFLRIKGDNEVAFSPVVGFGKNSAFPHHLPDYEILGGKRMFLIDLGAKYCGYCADLTRVFFLDKMPLSLKKIYDIVRGAKDLVLKKIRPGLKGKEIDRIARQFIEKKGKGKNFGHGLGHGVGLCVHEKPFLNPHSEEIVRENMVLTIEPAIYLTNRVGVRLESMVVVTSVGAEVLDGTFYQ